MTDRDALTQKDEELEKRLSTLQRQNEEYKKIINASNLKNAEKEYKDRLFKFIFGNPANKAWTLSLYNAINGTSYTNPNDIEFNTIGDVVYMKMKNDVSYMLYFEMNLWEHQATFNPNIPMRFFLYGGALYEKYTMTSKYYKFSSILQKIPRPKCVCFYNGTMEQPERQVLRLSDAYDGDGDIEVKVTMLNINDGKNKALMEACAPLREYAWLVDAVRRHQKEGMYLDTAVDAAIEEMSDEYMIKPFIIGNRAEVKNMFLTEYDEEKTLAQERQDGIDMGIDQANERMAKDMLADGIPMEMIIKYSTLSEDSVRSLAKQYGLMIV